MQKKFSSFLSINNIFWRFGWSERNRDKYKKNNELEVPDGIYANIFSKFKKDIFLKYLLKIKFVNFWYSFW